MKYRIVNTKKLVEELEFLRQGFRDATDLIATRPAHKMSMDAYHENADRLIVELGGDSVRDEKQRTKDT